MTENLTNTHRHRDRDREKERDKGTIIIIIIFPLQVLKEGIYRINAENTQFTGK